MALRISGCGFGRCYVKRRQLTGRGVGYASRMRAARRCRHRSGLCSNACAKKDVDPREARAAVIELEERLLVGQRKRQQLREAGTDPGARIELMRRRHHAGMLLDHALEEPDARSAIR